MKSLILIISLLLLANISISAQQKKDISKKDSVSKEPVDSSIIKHSPRKATIMSAILPGLGQVYNKKYWKVPLIYSGFATIGYFIVTNNQQYQIYQNAFKVRANNDTLNSAYGEFVNKYTQSQLQEIRDYYRRYKDLNWILGGLLYILNVVDADVDAHLFYFDVSDKLTLNWKPSFYQDYQFRNYAGLTFKLNF